MRVEQCRTYHRHATNVAVRPRRIVLRFMVRTAFAFGASQQQDIKRVY